MAIAIPYKLSRYVLFGSKTQKNNRDPEVDEVCTHVNKIVAELTDNVNVCLKEMVEIENNDDIIHLMMQDKPTLIMNLRDHIVRVIEIKLLKLTSYAIKSKFVFLKIQRYTDDIKDVRNKRILQKATDSVEQNSLKLTQLKSKMLSIEIDN